MLHDLNLNSISDFFIIFYLHMKYNASVRHVGCVCDKFQNLITNNLYNYFSCLTRTLHYCESIKITFTNNAFTILSIKVLFPAVLSSGFVWRLQSPSRNRLLVSHYYLYDRPSPPIAITPSLSLTALYDGTHTSSLRGYCLTGSWACRVGSCVSRWQL